MEATIEKRTPKSVYEVPFELPEYLAERVREKAYELWQQRGRRQGKAVQDWFDAERIVMETVK